MHIVIAIAGALQILGGIAVYMGAASAIHQILGAVSLGFGILAVAATLIISELQKIVVEVKTTQARFDAREAGDLDRHTDMKKVAAVFDRIAQKQAERIVTPSPPA